MTTIHDDLFAREHRFWSEGEGYFEEALASECLLVFPDPIGTLDRGGAIASIGGSPRWTQIAFADTRALEVAPEHVLIAYAATAQRAGEALVYRARAATLYAKERGEWRLVFHQQTPAAPT